MRNILLALTTGAALCGTVLLAGAAAPDERQPEARAYLNFRFGGATPASESFFYGLRLDRPVLAEEAGLRPALMTVEFTRGGFSSASLNGMPFVQQLRLNQDEEGSSSDTQWTAIDWGLLAAGVVGVGFAVAEVADSQDESPDPAPGGSTTGDTTGDTTGGTCVPGTPLCLPFGARDGGTGVDSTAQVLDLDGGTGYMGDLIPQ